MLHCFQIVFSEILKFWSQNTVGLKVPLPWGQMPWSYKSQRKIFILYIINFFSLNFNFLTLFIKKMLKSGLRKCALFSYIFSIYRCGAFFLLIYHFGTVKNRLKQHVIFFLPIEFKILLWCGDERTAFPLHCSWCIDFFYLTCPLLLYSFLKWFWDFWLHSLHNKSYDNINDEINMFQIIMVCNRCCLRLKDKDKATILNNKHCNCDMGSMVKVTIFIDVDLIEVWYE